MTAFLIRIDGYDPVADAAVILLASSANDDRVCHLNSDVWWPAVTQLPALRYDLFDGSFGGAIQSPQSSLALAIEPWPDFPRYMLADSRIQIWSGQPGDAWSAYVQRFDGRVLAQPSISNGVATIAFGVNDTWLDQPLLTTYAGTGGAEGDAALKGQVKPLAIGAPRYAPGRLIDSTNTVVQLSGYGAIEDVETAMDRLSRFSASVGDYANYTALVAATIPPGRWATAKAAGLVRHGAPPEGKLSYHARGDKVAGWVRKP
ncbi:MAG TPA: hypothetical protein VM662_07030, partial [Sphingomonas sp.]|nr:hypothetical protein [Sphingomonas sp.]